MKTHYVAPISSRAFYSPFAFAYIPLGTRFSKAPRQARIQNRQQDAVPYPNFNWSGWLSLLGSSSAWDRPSIAALEQFGLHSALKLTFEGTTRKIKKVTPSFPLQLWWQHLLVLHSRSEPALLPPEPQEERRQCGSRNTWIICCRSF